MNRLFALVSIACNQYPLDKDKLPHWMRGSHGGGGKSEVRAGIIKTAKRRAKNGKKSSVARLNKILESIGTENKF